METSEALVATDNYPGVWFRSVVLFNAQTTHIANLVTGSILQAAVRACKTRGIRFAWIENENFCAV